MCGVQNYKPPFVKPKIEDNIKLHLRQIYSEVQREDGCNWLRIVSSDRLWY
jgi:hypothetical protein